MRHSSTDRFERWRQAIAFATMCMAAPVFAAGAQWPGAIRNAAGMQLLIVREHAAPALRLVLPGHPASDRTIEVLFPEHVTAKRQGAQTTEQLYLFRPGGDGEHPAWRRIDQSFEYTRDFADGVHLTARATLESDGVRFQYEFTNRGTVPYDMIYAVTDPRLTSIFHDERLERTYVHHANGFDLLASETPARLTMPLANWLPSRYRASYTWPVPAQRTDRQDDGIMFYNKSRAVDMALVATVSPDGAWIVASYTKKAGNVWSNPALTCQHVDPQAALAPGATAILEIKLLLIRGTLPDLLTAINKPAP